MCNACGFYCCASDEDGGCGCEHCPCEECWPDDIDEDGQYDDEGFYCEAIEPEKPRHHRNAADDSR